MKDSSPIKGETAEANCTLSDQELLERCDEWISKLARSGGREWCLQIPVNFNRDPDMLFCELINRFKKLEDYRRLSSKEEWISVKERLPDENVSVLVFIPEEDDHITTGMWDVSKKWVLLDEYRVPKSEVTYWRAMVEAPEDKSYNKSPHRYHEEDTMSNQIRTLQKKVFDLEHGRLPSPPKEE